MERLFVLITQREKDQLKGKKGAMIPGQGEGLEPNKTTANRFGALQFIASRSKSSNISSYLSVYTIQDTRYRIQGKKMTRLDSFVSHWLQ
jgi:hypothetical protein